MDPMLFDNLREFVKPYYGEKGDLEDIEHVQRLLSDAKALAQGQDYDEDRMIFGAYFHGLIFTHESEIRDFLFSLRFDRAQVIQIMKVAWESGREAVPESVEGALLHDAHLIEGGKEFQIAKWLIGAASSGQTLPQVVEFLGDRLIGKYQCHTPPGREIHSEIESYRKGFTQAIKAALASGNAAGEAFPGIFKGKAQPGNTEARPEAAEPTEKDC